MTHATGGGLGGYAFFYAPLGLKQRLWHYAAVFDFAFRQVYPSFTGALPLHCCAILSIWFVRLSDSGSKAMVKTW